MSKIEKLQAELDAAKKKLHKALTNAFPIGTKVVAELREKRFARATISHEGCWWTPEYLRMRNDRTGRSFTRRHNSVSYG